MSIRLTALYIFVATLSIYAWKDWFKSLCGLILLMAVIQHEDMPKSMLGIQGFNMWNVLMFVVLLAWLVSRRREGLMWDMPGHMNILLLLYVGVIIVGVLRAVLDRSYIGDYPLKSLISEELINTVKWVLPGILLFDGCRSRRRLCMAVVCLLAMYVLISVQVIKRMLFESALGGSDGIHHIRMKICASIGYSSVDMSTFLAGASWAILATLPLLNRKKYKVLVLGLAGMVAFSQALTGGRAGYLAWAATGLVLCLLKWRKLLLLAPVVVMLLPVLLPGAAQRMLTGFGESNVAGQKFTNDYDVTSGRTLIWPYVIDKICESPLIGYGRLGMNRTGLANQIMTELGEPFSHPHNMYLETLLDNGILGSIPILLFWGLIVIYSAQSFRGSDSLCSAVGGLALSLVLAQLFAGIGSQHFYARESTLGTWAALFLSLRVYVEHRRVQTAVIAVERPWEARQRRQQTAIDPVYARGAAE